MLIYSSDAMAAPLRELVKVLKAISAGNLVRRLGMAPGFRAPLKLQAPIGRKLAYGCAHNA